RRPEEQQRGPSDVADREHGDQLLLCGRCPVLTPLSSRRRRCVMGPTARLSPGGAGCPQPSDGCRWQVLLLVQEFEPREVRAMGRTTEPTTAKGPRAAAAAAVGVFGPVALAGRVRSCVAALRGGAPGAGAGGWAV